MSADIPRFRLRRVRGDVHQYFVKMDPDRTLTLADFDSIGSAKLFTQSGAIEFCKYFRANNLFDCRVVTLEGQEIFEDETKPPVVEQPDNRKPVYDDVSGVRIVPGAAGAWYIRFPNSPYESIRGTSAEETLKKYNEHPQHLELSKFVEKCVPPPEPPPDIKKIQRQIEKEILNGRKRRPGDQ